VGFGFYSLPGRTHIELFDFSLISTLPFHDLAYYVAEGLNQLV
jgi:hypothetical protein